MGKKAWVGLCMVAAISVSTAVHAHFLSPDPVPPKPGDIFGFNRYAYANNNPVVNIDPTGAYTCVDDPISKLKNTPINCHTVNKAVQDLHQAARNPNLSAPAHFRLLRILKRLGKAGVANGVVIYTAGHTIKGKNIGGGTIVDKHGTVQMGLALPTNYKASGSQISANDFAQVIAVTLGHEGTHMIDELTWGNPNSWVGEYGTELRALSRSVWKLIIPLRPDLGAARGSSEGV